MEPTQHDAGHVSTQRMLDARGNKTAILAGRPCRRLGYWAARFGELLTLPAPVPSGAW